MTMMVIGPVVDVDVAMSVCLDVTPSLVEITEFFVMMTMPTRVSIAGVIIARVSIAGVVTGIVVEIAELIFPGRWMLVEFGWLLLVKVGLLLLAR